MGSYKELGELMRIINKEDSYNLLYMNECIDVMKETLISLSKEEGKMPLRTAMAVRDHDLLGIMPSYLPKSNVFGTKIISIFPDNHLNGIDSHQGVVMLFDDENGSIKAVVDAISITAIRTAAVSAVATDLLAREDAKVLSILGAGQQGRTHLEAMLFVRDISKVYVWDYYYESAVKFSTEMSEKHGIEAIPCKTVKACTEKSDIICTVTLAKEPILHQIDVKQGAHINAVGACRPEDREISSDLVVCAKVYADRLDSTFNEAGDVLIPMKEGLITKEHVIGEIGDLLMNNIIGRENRNEITMFEAQGLAIEDLACAKLIYDKACKKNIGVVV